MDVLRITGGAPLSGTVAASGAKNAVLPIMAAALLADGPVTLRNVPELTDVDTLAQLLERLGSEVTCHSDRLDLRLCEEKSVRAPYSIVRRMRATFCVLGPLLAKRGRAVVALPGGCRIGERPVDLHLRGLAALGAEIKLQRGCVVARAKHLRGAKISLLGPKGPTVTGTANVLSAAVLAKGETVLLDAAREPEIVDLGRFLMALGARIDGLGTATLRIRGAEQLGGTDYRVIPDRIETATLLIAGAIAGGSVRVESAAPEHLTAVLDLLETAGARIEMGANWVALAAAQRLRSFQVAAEPYPGVPTDVQAQLTALAAVATGTSRIADGVFPERFAHVPELIRLGADIVRRGNRAEVRGSDRLSGADVTASDLRASSALVLAGLAAKGTTTVRRIHHLDRGYQRLDEKLRMLSARIERAADVPPARVATRREPALAGSDFKCRITQHQPLHSLPIPQLVGFADAGYSWSRSAG